MYTLGLGSPHSVLLSIVSRCGFDGLQLLEASLMGSGNYTYYCEYKDKIWNGVRNGVRNQLRNSGSRLFSKSHDLPAPGNWLGFQYWAWLSSCGEGLKSS